MLLFLNSCFAAIFSLENFLASIPKTNIIESLEASMTVACQVCAIFEQGEESDNSMYQVWQSWSAYIKHTQLANPLWFWPFQIMPESSLLITVLEHRQNSSIDMPRDDQPPQDHSLKLFGQPAEFPTFLLLEVDLHSVEQKIPDLDQWPTITNL
jgi:hypothetical protein